MTSNEFNNLCQSHAIDPSIALENDNIREALLLLDDEKVEEVLIAEF
jgi:hypothetical protein